MVLEIAMAAPEAWALDSVTDLHEAQVELVERGFKVSVDAYRPVEAPTEVRWMLKATEDVAVPQHPPVECTVGDRLVLAVGVLRRMTADEFAAVQA
ncbi:hypothetical protein [Tsukamurella tyrosinosolvens]|uniref:hypothetical protein n=1 Tax=Tsukamurella tyrosinosolvens TaxID=57704 RepID=UPI002DD437CD|nr:hypothetical protein [Tsukamurella tyrosinosolvens]MEC4616179.1 hypothetical protein [Tsukamurella tyrosinosolvens]